MHVKYEEIAVSLQVISEATVGAKTDVEIKILRNISFSA